MKWIMIKVKEVLTVLLAISIIGLVWCASLVIFLATVALVAPTIINMLI